MMRKYHSQFLSNFALLTKSLPSLPESRNNPSTFLSFSTPITFYMSLQPLPYHLRVRDHFKQQRKTWDFFSAAKTKEDQLQQFKTELLKNTYKFDSASDRKIYDKVDAAKEKLDLKDLPVTVYQAQYNDELNASIVFLGQEAHIVFSGRLIQMLSEDELLAVIAHELTHVKLYVMLENDLEVTGRIITAIANNYNSEAAYFETARLFKLYTEIFCDRGACKVVGKAEPIITSLVKIATGLDSVNAENYLKQADEIFNADDKTKAETVSHPENFIRARAADLWLKKQEDHEAEITRMIEGNAGLDELDIFRQQELTDLTRQILSLYLKPKWFQSTMIMSQARQYFPDFASGVSTTFDSKLIDKIEQSHNSIKNYLSYVLMDFALVDSTLEEIPTGWAFQFSEDLQLKNSFEAIMKKEMKLSDKKLNQYRQKTLAAYHEVKESESEQIYEG